MPPLVLKSGNLLTQPSCLPFGSALVTSGSTVGAVPPVAGRATSTIVPGATAPAPPAAAFVVLVIWYLVAFPFLALFLLFVGG